MAAASGPCIQVSQGCRMNKVCLSGLQTVPSTSQSICRQFLTSSSLTRGSHSSNQGICKAAIPCVRGLYMHAFTPRKISSLSCQTAFPAMERPRMATVEVQATLVKEDSKGIDTSQILMSNSRLEEANSDTSLSTVAPSFELPHIKEAKRVVLVRHGESTWNREGRIQGSSDFAVLTPKGEIQAETNRQMLMDASFDALFHSPLARAKKTAEIIWGSRSAPVHSIDELREIDLYGFQGLLKHEGKEKYGDNYRMWQKDAPNFEIDGHYPVRELWERARICWLEILRSPARSILVVAHNAVNQALVATATGLGPEYFRQLLQSNCGVSVLDFAPRGKNEAPSVCLDRLNQTPSPPVAGGQSGGRKCQRRLILVCHGATDSSTQGTFPTSDDEPMTMLGVIQSRKTAELLLDTRVDVLLTSPLPRSLKTAEAIAEVQEAAECLGVRSNCRPNFLDPMPLPELREMDVGTLRGQALGNLSKNQAWMDRLLELEAAGGEGLNAMWRRAGQAWESVLHQLSRGSDTPVEEQEPEDENWTVVAVGDKVVNVAMLGHCLGLDQDALGLFHLDTGSLSVIDFPDGASGRGIVRCLNYTAHLGRWAVPVTRPTLGDEDF